MSLNPAQVHVRNGVLTVDPGGLSSRERPFADTGTAARFLAAAIWKDGEYYPGRSLTDPAVGFDNKAFEALVDEEVDALRAGSGWRIHATSGKDTVWGRTDTDPFTHEVATRYTATDGEVPDAAEGASSLDPILRARGISPRAVVVSEGAARDVRSVRAPRDPSQPPAWHGLYRKGADWVTVATDTGATCFAVPLMARLGARQALRDMAEPEPQGMRL